MNKSENDRKVEDSGIIAKSRRFSLRDEVWSTCTTIEKSEQPLEHPIARKLKVAAAGDCAVPVVNGEIKHSREEVQVWRHIDELGGSSSIEGLRRE